MSELAPPTDPVVRRVERLERIRSIDEQIARLTAYQRLEIAALTREDTDGRVARYVADELAMVWHRSPRQARTRIDGALVFADFPAVHAKIGDGTWLIDHADAVLDELAGSGLEHAQQEQVLDLLVSRDRRRTPWELRNAVRTAMVVLFPEHAAERADKAQVDRDVRIYHDLPGVASLLAHGPAAQVAAMMASLDALTWPPAPDDDRTVAQRRFDTLYRLVCGQEQPGQWQACLLVSLATAEGHDDLPGELVGHGPIAAKQARELLTGAEVRRVVVDDNGRLVAVDSTVRRPDLMPEPGPTPAVPSLRTGGAGADGPARDAEPDEAGVEPDPDAPTADAVAWLEANTDRSEVYAEGDVARSRSRAAFRPATAAHDRPTPHPLAGSARREPLVASRWSASDFTTMLHRLRTDPVTSLDLSSDKYAVPVRLKRHLELRDRTCVFPGCPRRAEQCDKDHLIPWPRGSTSEPNLADECEPHHKAKHNYFTVTRLPDGTVRWTLPCGLFFDRPPRPVLESWAFRDPRCV